MTEFDFMEVVEKKFDECKNVEELKNIKEHLIRIIEVMYNTEVAFKINDAKKRSKWKTMNVIYMNYF